MRVLLFGNPGMYHSYLAQGLREMGHEVSLVSYRYGWRNFPGMDVVLERRRDINGKLALLLYLWQVLKLLPKWRNYDVVQFHNCGFLELRGTHLMPVYRYLRRHNRHIILGVCDIDYHVADQTTRKNVLRYSEQRIGDRIIHNDNIDPLREMYFDGWYTDFSQFVARDADAIVPVLYEYWACYEKVYPEKTRFLPFPVVIDEKSLPTTFTVGEKVKLFMGLQRDRMLFKGHDIMLKAVQDIARDYPDLCELQIAENVPYKEYEQMINGCDVLLDQLYSYTPAMNALLAMSKGIVVVGGGEPENYEILGEDELRPIINVLPDYESVYEALKELIYNKQRIPELKRQSVEYVVRHHDYRKVAKRYEALYLSLK